MSLLSGLIGKIPLVGGLINDVGKVLPSGGQLLGGAMLGPVGSVVGGAIDGNTSPLQKTVGNTIAGAEGVLGGATALGGLAGGAGASGAAGGLEGAIAKIPGGSEILDAIKSGAAPLSSLLGFLKDHSGDLLAAANVAEAAMRQQKADKYATNAVNTATDAYNAKAPLRMAGINGMLHPTTPDLSSLRTLAGSRSGNPFARSLPMAGMPMAGGASFTAPTPTVNGAPPGPVFMPGGSQTAPRPLPIERAPMTGAIPRLAMPV